MKPASRPTPYLMMTVLLVLALSITSCGPTPPPTDENGEPDPISSTLRVAITAYPPSMDPFTGWTHLAALVYHHVTEQLLTYDENWAITPLLAEDYYSNEDYTEWTLELRQGVRFHDGTEMTADDVVASINRFRETSPRASDLAVVEQIETPDKYTVKLILSEPLPILPVHLAYPMAGPFVLPAHVLADLDGPFVEAEQLIGTGPYMLAEAIPDQHVRLARFEDYVPNDSHFASSSGYGGLKTAHLDEVLLIPVPEAASRTAGILAGDYHFAQDVPKGDYETILATAGVDALINPAQWMPCLWIRNQPDGLLGQLEFRRAVQVALDMDELMLAAAERPDFYRLDSSLFFKETVWHCPAGDTVGLYNVADPDRSREILEQNNYDGRDLVIIANTDYDWMYRAAIVLNEQLKAAGFNVDLQLYDWATAVNVRNQTSDWDLFVSGDSIAHDGSYMNYWHTDQDWLGYSNPVMDELIERGMQHDQFEDRYPIYCELAQALYEDVAFIKFGDLHEMHAISDAVEGFRVHNQLRFWDVRLTQ